MPAAPGSPSSLREVVLLFLRLGVTAFGGPAAHIAMMRDEVVVRRRWLSDQEFLDLLGATNLIPGPNSTEMAIHLGYRRAGWRGLVGAGAAFILPATLIVSVIAWVYVRYGRTPEATALLYGVVPAIMAVVVQALWGLGRAALKDVPTVGVGTVALVLYLLGADEIALLVAGAVAVAAVRRIGWHRRARQRSGETPAEYGLVWLALAPAAVAATAAVPFSLARLFAIFLKIGSVLYGSGYVLLAFLRADVVERLRWLTDRQLLDAIAIGQFTPGPVFTTATFIGYLLGGAAGAAVATVGIFLPAFVFVAVTHPHVAALRRSPLTGALLDGVNAASLALMAGVTWQLLRTAVVDVPTALIAAGSLVALVRTQLNSAWLVAVGGLLGLLLRG